MQFIKISNRMFKIKLTDRDVLNLYGGYSVFTNSPQIARQTTEKIAKTFFKGTNTLDLYFEVKAINKIGAEIIVFKKYPNGIYKRDKKFAVYFKQTDNLIDFAKILKKESINFNLYKYKNTYYILFYGGDFILPAVSEYSGNYTDDETYIAVIKEYGKLQ